MKNRQDFEGFIELPSYPWYDDRAEELFENPFEDAPEDTPPQVEDPPRYDTPKKIFEYLEQCVWKQQEAKRAAALIMYKCRKGIKSNALFIGPTGCGKTHIWRCLKQIFPDRIEIVDASNITKDGWVGGKKWISLLNSPVFLANEPAILVLDEADKLLAPKYSAGGSNVSEGIQSEGLTLMEGARVKIDDVWVDTSHISFVLCGAFSGKARELARESGGRRVGFDALLGAERPVPYAKPLTEEDIISSGAMPEFVGRIQSIVNLEPLTVEDFFGLTGDQGITVKAIREQYGIELRLSPRVRWELAEQAFKSGLGVRGMENRIRQLVDDALFEDCQRSSFEF